MRSSQTLHVYSHRPCECRGGTSSESYKIHKPGLSLKTTYQLLMCNSETLHVDSHRSWKCRGGISLESCKIHKPGQA